MVSKCIYKYIYPEHIRAAAMVRPGWTLLKVVLKLIAGGPVKLLQFRIAKSSINKQETLKQD